MKWPSPSTLSPRRNRSPAYAQAPWGLLRDHESQLLYDLARDHYRGAGVIVDAGSFLGRSAWLLATGLAANAGLPREQKLPIHCFDNFIVNDGSAAEAIRKQFGITLMPGASTRRLFDEAIAEVAEWLEVHEGDFHTYLWQPRPIEILFIDIAKSTSLNRRLVTTLFPCLLPGRSIVVQQDYHHPWLPHLHTTMEYLSDYFEIVEPKTDDSAAFLCTRAVPPEVAAAAATLHDTLAPADLLTLMDRAIARLPAEHRCHVELARANLIGMTWGAEWMQAELEAIDTRHGIPAGDEFWLMYRAEMHDLVAQRLGSWEARDARIWIETAWLRLDHHDPRGAVMAARRAYQLSAGGSSVVTARALDVLGVALSAGGEHGEAVAIGARAVECNPDDASVRVHYAYSLGRAGRWTPAAATAKAASGLDPANGLAAATLAIFAAGPRADREAMLLAQPQGELRQRLEDGWRRVDSRSDGMIEDARIRDYLQALIGVRMWPVAHSLQQPQLEGVETPTGQSRIPDAPAFHAALSAIELFHFCYGSAAEDERCCQRIHMIRGTITPGRMTVVAAQATIHQIQSFVATTPDGEFALAVGMQR